MEPEISFIDENGNEISKEGVFSHTGLSNAILKENDKLKKEYEESGIYDMADFFVIKKGYLKVNRMYGKVVTFVGMNISKIQEEILKRFEQKGYKLDDLHINVNRFNGKDEFVQE